MAKKAWLSMDYFATILGAACIVASTVAYHPISDIDKSYPQWFAPAFERFLWIGGTVFLFLGATPALKRRDLGPLLIGMLAVLLAIILRWMAKNSPEAYAGLLGESVLAAIIAVAAAPRFLPPRKDVG